MIKMIIVICCTDEMNIMFEFLCTWKARTGASALTEHRPVGVYALTVLARSCVLTQVMLFGRK